MPVAKPNLQADSDVLASSIYLPDLKSYLQILLLQLQGVEFPSLQIHHLRYRCAIPLLYSLDLTFWRSEYVRRLTHIGKVKCQIELVCRQRKYST